MRKIKTKKQGRLMQRLASGILSLSLISAIFLPLGHEVVHAEEAGLSSEALVQDLEEQMRNLFLLDASASLDKWPHQLPITVSLKDQDAKAASLAADLYMYDDEAVRQRDLLVRKQQEEFIKQANAILEPDLVTEHHVTLVDNAFSTEVTYEQLVQLAQIPGIARFYHNFPVISKPIMTQGIEEVKPQTSTYSDRMAFDPATAKGQGQVLSIIDSGFDSDHKTMYLSDETLPTLSEENVQALIAKHKLPGKYYSKKIPYGYNYADGNQNIEEPGESHGTHVAGIAAGQPDEHGKYAGVAPEAQVLCMRVFGAGKKTTSPMSYVKAVDDSVKLQASSINMSLGQTYASKNELNRGANITTAIATAKAMGATVNISAGNDGYASRDTNVKPKAEDPHYATVGVPSLAEESISIASIESLEMLSPVMHVEGAKDLSYLPGRVVPIDTIYNQQFEVVDVKRAIIKEAKDGKEAQNDLDGVDLQGKAALIERGDITFVDKVNHVAKKGAKLAIIYNHEEGGNDYVGMALDGTTIPAISLKREDGLTLLEKLKAKEKPLVTVTKEVGSFSYASAGKLSDFSSWGPTPEFDLKPELTARGGNVYAAQPDDTYGNMSGTSMAAPQVTGAIAILNQRLDTDDTIEESSGTKRYYFMKNIAMSTAIPHEKDQADTDPYSSPRKQGAGVMSLDNMLKTKAYVTVAGSNPETDLAKVGLGYIENKVEFNVRIHNISKTETLRFKPTTTVQTDRLDDQNPVFIVPVGTRRILEDIQGEEITVAPGKTVTFTVAFDISAKVPTLEKEFINGFFVEGFVRLKSLTENQPDLGLPYVGFHGTKTHPNYYDAPVLEKPIYEYKDLSKEAKDFPRFYHLEGAMENPFTALTTTTDKGKTVVLGEVTETAEVKTETEGKDTAEDTDKSKALDEQESPVRRFDQNSLFFSPNGDGHYDAVQFQGSFTGHYRDAFIRVLDDQKQEVYTGVAAYGISPPNFYVAAKPETKRLLVTAQRSWRWDGRNRSYQKVPDGRYTLEFSYRGILDSAKPHVLQFPILVDTVAPSLTEATYHEDTQTFTAKLVETGSGLDAVTLLSPSSDQAKPMKQEKLEVTKEKTIRINRPLSELKYANIQVHDRAGNKKTVPIITLLAGDKIGKVNLRFQNDKGALERINPQLYKITAIDTKDNHEFTDLNALPFGTYKIKLELDSVVHEIEKTEGADDTATTAGKEVAEKTITIDEAHKTVDVVFVVKNLKGFRTNVRVDFEPNGIKYLGSPKLKATNQQTKKTTYLPYSDTYGYLFSFNGELTAGTWTLEVEALAEGWVALPSRWEITIKETDQYAPTSSVTLFKGKIGHIRPQAIVEDKGFDPSILQYHAFSGSKIFESVEHVPVGKYVVFPTNIPDGYYVTPVWQEVVVEENKVATPSFNIMKVTPERMGKVSVETKMADGSEPIEVTYKALRLSGNTPVTTLDELPFGTWFISPDKHDPRYIATPNNQKIELGPDNREINLSFTWTKLNQVGKKGSIFFTLTQRDRKNLMAFNQAMGKEMAFELEDLDSGKKSVVKAKPTFSGIVILNEIPFGYYAVRPQCPTGFYTSPAVQFARVSRDTIKTSLLAPDGLNTFVVEKGEKPATSGMIVDEQSKVSVDLQNTVLEGVVSLNVKKVEKVVSETGDANEPSLKNADVFDITLVDQAGKTITKYDDLAEFKAKVFLPVKAGMDAQKASAYYLPEGKAPVKLKSEVSEKNGQKGLVFEVSHFSRYAIKYAVDPHSKSPAPAPGTGTGDLTPAPGTGTGTDTGAETGNQPVKPAPAPGTADKKTDKNLLSKQDAQALNFKKEGRSLAYFSSVLPSSKTEQAAHDEKKDEQKLKKDLVPKTGEKPTHPSLPLISFVLGLTLASLSFLLRRPFSSAKGSKTK